MTCRYLIAIDFVKLIVKNNSNRRLLAYDYSKPGQYFITICCKYRKRFFGEIDNEKMLYSDIGQFANDKWVEIPDHFQDVLLWDFVIMPNHLHGIIEIKQTEPFVSTHHDVSQHTITNKFGPLKSGSVSVIIGQFKATVTRWCNKNNIKNFDWQPRFHDHVIRNSSEFTRIQNYISNNVKNWKYDDYY